MANLVEFMLLTISGVCLLYAYLLLSAPKDSDKNASRATAVGWVSVAVFFLAGGAGLYLMFYSKAAPVSDTGGDSGGGSDTTLSWLFPSSCTVLHFFLLPPFGTRHRFRSGASSQDLQIRSN